MSSRDTDQADRRDRIRQADATLAADRQGRGRLRRRADTELPPSHGDKSRDLPNTSPGGGR
jgi:hypothetical protein